MSNIKHCLILAITFLKEKKEDLSILLCSFLIAYCYIVDE